VARSCVHTLFERIAARTPGATAVIDGERSLSYAELNSAADRLAEVLRGAGAVPGGYVPIALGRSIEMLQAQLEVILVILGDDHADFRERFWNHLADMFDKMTSQTLKELIVVAQPARKQ